MPLKAINTIPSSHFFKARMIKQLFFFALISDPRVGTDERLVTFSENSCFLCVSLSYTWLAQTTSHYYQFSHYKQFLISCHLILNCKCALLGGSL